MSNPFDYINGINNKSYNFDDLSVKDYNPFMVNMGFSYFQDTVLLANVLNIYPECPYKMQYDFLYYSVTKKKRFSKWSKKEEINEDIEIIMNYFNCSYDRAKEIKGILTEEQIKEIKETQFKGGKK
jgi:nitrogen regulatory protein PII-like uncharacterized protein